ncbi:MAG: DNA polymerase domain-containing protein [Promethearchaeota archaeon]
MKKKLNAWILDLTLQRTGITLWLKTEQQKTIRVLYPYHPSFYITFPHSVRVSLSSTIDEEYRHLIPTLGEHPDIESVTLCKRRIKAEHSEPSSVLRVQVRNPSRFKTVIRDLEAMEQFELLNIDLPIIQMFFYETGLFPFAYCKVSMIQSKNGYIAQSINLLESNEDIFYELPPLRVIWIEFETLSEGLRISKTDPITKCKITIDPSGVSIPLSELFPSDELFEESKRGLQVILNEGNEFETLMAFERAIKRIDPDIIFTRRGDEEMFPYLLSRLSYHHLDREFSLSRDGTPLGQTRFMKNGGTSFMSYGVIYHRSNSEFYLTGRLHIDSAIYGGLHFDDGNLYGIVEVARVSYTSLQRLTRITIGGALQSLQFYHAYQQGVLIPADKKNTEYFRDGFALLKSDRGGHILNPKVGMFERVAELDFTSMYPALMVKYNVSPEAINCKCCKETGMKVPGLEYHICEKRKGIVPLSLRVPLTKRIKYKKLSKGKKGKEAAKYRKMEEALKWILVVCFGYLGFRNARFGRIEAHQTVCAFAREFLLNSMQIIENHGLIAIHGIVDSLYAQAPPSMDNATFHQECSAVVKEIAAKTQIPIEYKHDNNFFEFMCFLPTKADPVIGALNRYWGVKSNGNIKVRGLELRRHDTPPFIKMFQHELMTQIAQSSYRLNFLQLYRKTISPLLLKYSLEVELGKISASDLAITIRLTRGPQEYKVNNYQACAAKYLQRHGVIVGPGEKISFVIINDKAKIPENRVLPLDLFKNQQVNCDVGKYKELLVRAFKNVIPFEISKSILHELDVLISTRVSTSLSQQKTMQSISCISLPKSPKVQKTIMAFLT